MKKTLAIIFILQISLYSYGQLVIEQIIPDTIVLKLKISSCSKQVFFNGHQTASLIYTENYDSLGRVVEELTFNNNLNRLSIRKQFLYDSVGNISQEKYTRFSGDDSTTYIHKYSYNENGYLDSNSFGKIKYGFNESNQILKITEKTAKSYNVITEFNYDDQNNLISTLKYSGSRYPARTEYRYDTNGKLIKEINSYGSEEDPSTVYTLIYTYDDMNLVTEHTQIKTFDKYENKEDSRVYKYIHIFN